ncbi:phospholipase D-like domain-containing protein [Methanomassiliicoccus luminyensis]|uniref:phospholipase D-like domain-containing protein n=1 Tax=Methanomassiliicoccus luminyensis TaxID=1080712 RepID=UPI0003685715|nr:phospholipase D-like domain-containing protein [Methanomassiliicoccus luminyensis]
MAGTEPNFWGSYKGTMIKAIAVDGARTWDDLQELTGFPPKTINTVLSELFGIDAIYKTNSGEYRVAKDLYVEYRNYFVDDRKGDNPSVLKLKKEDQTNIIRAFQGWLTLKNISLVDHHLFVDGSRLNDLTNHLVENVRTELLIVNPYVDKGNIMDQLKILAQNKSLKIKILTRPPETGDKQEFMDVLRRYGIEVFTNKNIHAKIMVFDRGVAIVSSMNLIAYSAGGGSWEAGIATSSEDVVSEVVNKINLKFDEREASGWGENIRAA